MLAVKRDRVRTGRIDHDRAVETVLFLVARMAMIPIGPRLDEREFVGDANGTSSPCQWIELSSSSVLVT